MSSKPWFHVWESFLPSLPSRSTSRHVEYLPERSSIYEIWLLSRRIPSEEEKGNLLIPGGQRHFNARNLRLAYLVLTGCTLSFLQKIWNNHPCRTTMMVSFNIVRSLFPAFRGYSQALIIDEVQTLIASGACTWSRLLSLVGTELIRRYLESFIESIAFHNENIVLGSARFFVEREQMRQRVNLDVPTMEDREIRDLLHESDLFARSFHGGGFGSLTPLDFFQILGNITEILSHLFLVAAMTKTTAHFGILLFSLCSVALPMLLSQARITREEQDDLYSPREARAADRREKMRNLAYSDAHRPEILLFGLEDWILNSWASAWKVVFDSELSQSPLQLPLISGYHFSEMIFALQNIPFFILVQSSSASLGSLTLYRSSIQSIFLGLRALFTTTRMIFHSVFLLAAFCASMDVKPKLQPQPEQIVEYRSAPGGPRIQVRNLSYTYPGCDEAALKDVNFTLEAGETLAIVGYNGSGKSTLAKVLLRILDFDEGQLFVNDVDIRRYHPADYHKHTTAVFQGFSKFNSTVRENVGLGHVEALKCRTSVKTAIQLAEAEAIVGSLPNGLQTVLETPGFEALAYPGMPQSTRYHGLSGGEWQRIALARAFMRANNPNVDLLVFDEPTSSLDPHAQTQIFDTIHRISRNSEDAPSKTVIFITHRLSTARRADKVAMMENGTISEFGTHEELLKLKGSYASLYSQSI